MFYSQFILAKKGPLGTIWIAAHLERKLRKNQVADTDIGVSVDSILFPEVPIALRLSSHLLLGVVRIYSRKVNYLFHDCSEALLKIKQAFRSTAVDLPPEESIAPYHSITLPETFHLDDFELPDSAIQGDFIDHHISTREQITLQDTLDGAGFSTMQFGLDERFGDGNASQIGLDLDEDLFLEDNHPSAQHVSSIVVHIERAAHQGQSSHSVPPTHMDIDDDQFGLVKDEDIEDSKDLSNPSPSAGALADEIPATGFAECAHAPSTPGLVEEMFSANIHESPAFSPRQKLSPSIGDEAAVTNSANVMHTVSSPTSELTEQREQVTTSDETQMGCGQKSVTVLQNGYVRSPTKDLTVGEQGQDSGRAVVPKVVQTESLICPSDSNCGVPLDKSQVDAEMLATSELPADNLAVQGETSTINSTSCGVETQPTSCCSTEHIEDLQFISCNSQINQTNGLSAQNVSSAENVAVLSVEENRLHASESTFEVQDKDLHLHMINSTDAELRLEGNAQNVPVDSAEFVNNTDELAVDPSQKDTQSNQLNSCPTSEFPEPEKMMLAPNVNVEQANELSQVTEEKGIIESDGSVNRMTSLSGKKRHLMEITPAVENNHSGKMSGRSKLRKNSESVPDDDDLLASILVGKRTPLLKVGPTPPLPRTTSLKRPGLKRKVLLDDTTVLHADAIRQQLMNTEDIRRMRKKAPCTHPEVWMLQKSSLEEEIFNESIMTGISAQLNDINIRISCFEADTKNSCVDPSKEIHPDIRKANEIEPANLRPDHIDGETAGPSHVSLPTENKECEGQQQSGSVVPPLEQSDNDGQCTMLSTEICEKDKVAGEDIPFPSAVTTPSSLECKQLADNLVQTGDNCSVINDKALHLESASARDLADGDSEEKMVVNDVLAIVNDDPNMHVEDGHAASGTSIRDRSMESLDAATLDDPQDIAVVAQGANGETTISELDYIYRESEVGSATDLLTINEGDMSLQDEREGMQGAKVENEASVQTVNNQGILNTDISSEWPETEAELVPSALGESSGFQEFNIEGDMIVGSTPMDLASAKEYSDFYSAINSNDTEFLNVDDEADYHEDADIDVPNADTESLENSGWSSRTRGVARYLKALFDDESGRERESIAMDRLIAGKTRKEASRMFFETLVLKTKDYIHVEQKNPADYITIRPKSKLLKAEF